jgi:S-adenosylmethionine decarboxylase
MPSPNEHFNEEQCFEGPEKNLQVIFSIKGDSKTTLRLVKQERWQKMLDKAKCKILSSLSNEYCTAYILSESSLFVYEDRIILKTCGATPLLYASDDIVEIGNEIGLEPACVLYWRKNFNNPDLQDPIHRNFESEVSFLDAHFGGIKSSSAQLGSSEKDHFHFYYSELLPSNMFNPVAPTFEIKMHELHPCVSKKFFWESDRKQSRPDVLNQLQKSIPNYRIDEFFFDPCGYSMNAINEDHYETIHITPEDCCSYMSFEICDEKYIDTRIKEFRILELFRPASCSTIQITPSTEPDDGLKDQKPKNYKDVSSECVTLGSISIAFHSYETTENHPMITVAKLRQERMALINATAAKHSF